MKLAPRVRVAAIARDGERVLVHRADFEDFWSLPGGGLERGETSAECLRRELREELEIDVEPGPLCGVVESFFEFRGDTHHEVGFFHPVEVPAELVAREPWEAKDGDMRLLFRWSRLADLDLPPLPRCLPELLSAGGFRHLVWRASGR